MYTTSIFFLKYKIILLNFVIFNKSRQYGIRQNGLGNMGFGNLGFGNLVLIRPYVLATIDAKALSLAADSCRFTYRVRLLFYVFAKCRANEPG